MQKIAILTDSSSDLSKEEREQKGIFLLPLRIIYKDREYLDHLDISPSEVYETLDVETPTTSLPSPEYMDKIFDKIEAEGYTHVIGIFISNSLSGTMNAVRLQIQERTNFEYTLFDSGIIGYPLGCIVLKALEFAKQGKSFEEICDALPSIREKTTGYYTLNTLEYLRKGGRIGKVAGTIGQLLHLKPIITVGEDGAYITIDKARGRKQSLKKIKDLADDLVKKGACNLYILHGNARLEAEALMQSFVGNNNIKNLEIREIGPAMGVHAGPGMLAFAYQKEI